MHEIIAYIAIQRGLFLCENLFNFLVGLGEFVLTLFYKFLCNFKLFTQGIDIEVAVFHLFHYLFELFHGSFIIEFVCHNL